MGGAGRPPGLAASQGATGAGQIVQGDARRLVGVGSSAGESRTRAFFLRPGPSVLTLAGAAWFRETAKGEMVSSPGSNKEGRGKQEKSAVSMLRRARFHHHLWRVILSLVGGILAVLALQWSVDGDEDVWSKVAEALGGALLFASVTGIAVTILHAISRVERREIAVWEEMIAKRG